MRKRKLDSPIVGVSHNVSEKLALREALSYLPLEGFMKGGETVVITPNLVNLNPPNLGVTSGPESLRELLRFFKEKRAGRIVVATGSASCDTKKVEEQLNFNKIIQEEGVEFIDLNYGPYIDMPLGGNVIKETKINEILSKADIIVSTTQLKAHEEATMSGVIKNIALSYAPAEIHGFPKKNLGIHEDLHDFIHRMAMNIPIDLSILSLSPAMVGTGPSKGKAVPCDMVLASLDPVAIDTIGARLLGFRPQAVSYLFRCSKAGLGISNIEDIELKGDKLLEMEKNFSKLAYGKEFVIDE